MKKLRNKITGEINEFMIHKRIEDSEDGNPVYAPFDGDIDEWEDCEDEDVEEEFWYVDTDCETYGVSRAFNQNDSDDVLFNKSIGNYFETKEEAEKAVEKLKAWKRVKDKGFKFDGCGRYHWTGEEWPHIAFSYPNFGDLFDDSETVADLDLLFSGGEE